MTKRVESRGRGKGEMDGVILMRVRNSFGVSSLLRYLISSKGESSKRVALLGKERKLRGRSVVNTVAGGLGYAVKMMVD